MFRQLRRWARGSQIRHVSGRKGPSAPAWDAGPLEPRTMLDAAGGHSVAGAAAAMSEPTAAIAWAEQTVGEPGAELTAGAGELTADLALHRSVLPLAGPLIFVDSRVDDLESLLPELPDQAEVVLIDSSRDGLEQITAALRLRRQVPSVHILAHGAAGELQLGSQLVTVERLHQLRHDWQVWRDALSSQADVLIYGCDVASTTAGRSFIDTWAKLSGADVAGSTDRTGYAELGGDWVLELQTGPIEAQLIVSAAAQRAYGAVLPITVYAAGETGQEEMQLLVDGSVVQTWSNIGGDYAAGVFQAYTWDGGPTVTADRVRVAFTNDVFGPQGTDRNLRIDRIVVNGEEHQTEGPSVWTTGTSFGVDGAYPSFTPSEYLFTNGYFQYDAGIADQTVTIRAAGATGQETMQLWINDYLFQTWTNVSTVAQDYVFQSAEFVIDPAQVRIAFVNDYYDGATGVDYNLRVDRMTLGSGTFETEAYNVFSTGTYLSADGVVPGWRYSEWLNVNGFFDFGTPTNVTPITIRAQGETGDEFMTLQINEQDYRYWGYGDIGTSYYTYVYYDETNSVRPDDIRIVFSNDVYVPDGSYDTNLIVDSIAVGSTIYETEAPQVYSTGTWNPVTGVTPGFVQSQVLHTNGYFEYRFGQDL